MSTELQKIPSNPEGFEPGLTVEHILLSITVVHSRSIGQFDDSAAYQVRKALMGYQGIKSVNAKALYEHGKIETHPKGCDCHKCTYVNDEHQP